MIRGRSREEIVANKIADLISDLRLDLDEVGSYLARHRPNLNYNRLQEIADAAYYAKENAYEREQHDPLF